MFGRGSGGSRSDKGRKLLREVENALYKAENTSKTCSINNTLDFWGEANALVGQAMKEPDMQAGILGPMRHALRTTKERIYDNIKQCSRKHLI